MKSIRKIQMLQHNFRSFLRLFPSLKLNLIIPVYLYLLFFHQ